MFFRRKPKINEQTIQKLVQNLETAYINKDIKQLTDMFHPYHRDISFLDHSSLSMNFQIYDVTSTEHTKEFIEGNPVEYSDIIAQEEDYSIIEIKIQGRSGLQHELVLNIVASDGFFMIRFLQSWNTLIDEELRQHLIEQMKKAAAI
ncbi:hypothetical protein [Gracilibacillus timonensis]|uniref:hypothetical protein n=1 Tax=Gracilibacillus timonensis TaxID=1816696 RepID=UPI00082715B1|nr:hypothetical protein [Gracilibacillus timonensis]